MKKNPFWDTIWTKRDEEFYWSGCRFGVALGTVATSFAFFGVLIIIDEVKNRKQKNEG